MSITHSHDYFKKQLLDILGPEGVVDVNEQSAYEQGARYGAGAALAVVRPNTVDQVSQVVAWCVAHKISVIPQGANTGLVGASTPDTSGQQLVLSLSRLRQHCDVDVVNRSVDVDAGYLLSELNGALDQHGLFFPIDLGADPSIGGMIAANTGGSRLIKYGDVRKNVLALEVVLFDPPGKVVQLGRALRKDNTGTDLKQLFIGTSGTYGIVTRATLEVHHQPKQKATALLVPISDEAVPELLVAIENEFGDFVSAFEGISGQALQAVLAHIPSVRNPFSPEPTPDFAILVELEAGINAQRLGMDLQEAFTEFLGEQFDQLISNAIFGDANELWLIRHSITEGARHLGKVIAFDVSVPRSKIMAFRRLGLELMQQRYSFLHVVDFGHIADGGIHFNVIWPSQATQAYDAQVVKQLRDDIYQIVMSMGGSFSAEHGIGPYNMHYYHQYTSSDVQALSHQLKRLVDPEELCGTNFARV